MTAGSLEPPADLTLAQAAAALGVHYMTAYRYVRTGRLRAHYDGNQWWVHPEDLSTVRAAGQPGRRSASHPRAGRDYVADMFSSLVSGDDATAWQVTQDALTAGMTPERIYLDVLAPVMHDVGDRWTRDEATIVQEHLATATAMRLIGRLSPLFQRRGRRRGVIVLGAISGDYHALSTALLADPLRGRGFTVVDLGANVPADSFVEVIRSNSIGRRVIGVGMVSSLSASSPGLVDVAVAVRAGIAEYGGSVPPLLIGGAGADDAATQAGGFDAYSPSYRDAIDWFERQATRRRG